MDVALARTWIIAVADVIAEQADYLTELDAPIGDSDHGVNMNRGFSAVRAALDGAEPPGVREVFVLTGNTLVSKVGGASGPLFGTMFRVLGKTLPEGTTVDPAALGGALGAALEAVQKLGGAAPGDKTIIDAFAPAAAAFAQAAATGQAAGGSGLAEATAAAAAAAAAGMRATIPLEARKGRASYLGPRSVGHQDPGATSTWMIFQALADVTAAAP